MAHHYNIAIVGPKEVISGFRALGVDAFNATSGEEAFQILMQIKNDVESPDTPSKKYALVILIESLAADISSDEMRRITRGALPALVILPGIEATKGAGQAKLRALAEKAVGTDILS